MPVRERNVQRSVNKVEIETFPHWDHDEQGDEPNRMRGRSQHRRVAIGHRPEDRALIPSKRSPRLPASRTCYPGFARPA